MLDGVDPVLQSGRVSGSAHRSYLTKRVLRQRDALTVHQVATLENVVSNSALPIQDRMFAGQCLLCVFSRLRWVLRGWGISAQDRFLVGRARKILPVVGPEVDVTGVEWPAHLLKLRSIAGLRALPGRPFLPGLIPGVVGHKPGCPHLKC